MTATIGPWHPFGPRLLDVVAVNREPALLFLAPGNDDGLLAAVSSSRAITDE